MRISDWSSDVCSSDLLGVSVATASVTEPEIASCWSSASLPITSMVRGSAFAGRIERAAVTTIVSSPSGAGLAPPGWAGAGVDRTGVVYGESVSVMVYCGGGGFYKRKTRKY